jgi:hypothetical protein
VTSSPGFFDCVAQSWNEPIAGRPMIALWRKLLRLQPVLRKLSKPITGIHITLDKAREDLRQAHNLLLLDKMNPHHIMKVKSCTEEVIHWSDMEEQMLRQKSKIDWLKLGDGNNKYFHASLKAKQKHCALRAIYREDGTLLTTHEDIEMEVLHLYGNLMGRAETSLMGRAIYREDGTLLTTHEDIEMEVLHLYGNLMGRAETSLMGIDITAMRAGPQVPIDQRNLLIAPIQENEIYQALRSIGDLKAPGLDGYGASFFKATWSITKPDIIAAVLEFFQENYIYSAVNSTLVTLIPKHSVAKTIKEYRPISCCTTIFKIISKIMTMRLSKVLGSIINTSQAAFVPGHHIHDHILLAYELIRGYSRKGGTPKCMMQLDL